MRKVTLVSVIAGLVCVSSVGLPVLAQEPGGVWSYGITGSYSPDSSHILIGDSEQRQVWTLGATYSHVLGRQGPRLRFDYEASVIPVWEQRDPTVTATEFFVDGQAIITQQTPVRVVDVTHQPVGTILAGNGSFVPVYALFGTQNTYAAAATPLGFRVSAMPNRRIQPTFGVDLGFVVGSRPIPVDSATRYNFMFALGPGIEIYPCRHTSLRLEYVYRHASNAGLGDENPGLDQAVVRVTISRHR